MSNLVGSFIIASVSVILVVEVALRSPLIGHVHALLDRSGRALRLIGNAKISDHWKERILPSYALSMLRASVLILLWLAGLAFLFFACLYLGAQGFDSEFNGILSLQRADYVLSGLVVATVYCAARRFFHNA